MTVKPLGIGILATGLVILVLGVILGWIVVPNIIDAKVKDETQLRDGTDIYEKWVDIPVPIYLKMYVFNITNYEDYMSGIGGDWSAKPVVQELGPYVYKERRLKYDIVQHKESGTVSYRQNITYTFVRELSVGWDNDTINTINVPFYSIAQIVATLDIPLSPLIKEQIMNLFLGPTSRERLVKVGVPVREVVFGWRLNYLYDLAENVAAPLLNIPLPPEIHNGYFGYYLDKNDTNHDGLYEVYTGVDDPSTFGVIKYIDGKNRLDEWWPDYCAMINGTDGIMFPPSVKKDTLLYAYAPEICRSVWMAYQKEVTFEGIKGYRFGIPTEVFTSPVKYPDNGCYCLPVPKPLNDTCDFNGAGRLFSCKAGAPIIVSKPHFLDADGVVYDAVDGMKPDRDLHDTYIDIEPRTGFPIRASKKLQISIETQPLPLGRPWNTVQQAMIPAIWGDETAELDEALVDEIKSKLVTPLKIVNISRWTVVSVGTALTLGGIIYFVYTFMKT